MVNKFEKRHSIDFSLVLLLFIKFALFSASETDILEHLFLQDKANATWLFRLSSKCLRIWKPTWLWRNDVLCIPTIDVRKIK